MQPQLRNRASDQVHARAAFRDPTLQGHVYSTPDSPDETKFNVRLFPLPTPISTFYPSGICKNRILLLTVPVISGVYPPGFSKFLICSTVGLPNAFGELIPVFPLPFSVGSQSACKLFIPSLKESTFIGHARLPHPIQRHPMEIFDYTAHGFDTR
jgi:hypothetical protein